MDRDLVDNFYDLRIPEVSRVIGRTGDLAIDQSAGHCVGQAVIRGFPRLGPPLCGILGEKLVANIRGRHLDGFDIAKVADFLAQPNGAHDGRLHFSIRGIELRTCMLNPEILVLRISEHVEVQHNRSADLIEEAHLAFKDFAWTRHAVPGEIGAEDGAARGICSRGALPSGELTGADLPHSYMPIQRHAEGVNHFSA